LLFVLGVIQKVLIETYMPMFGSVPMHMKLDQIETLACCKTKGVGPRIEQR
jgi:hypothetical protein